MKILVLLLTFSLTAFRGYFREIPVAKISEVQFPFGPSGSVNIEFEKIGDISPSDNIKYLVSKFNSFIVDLANEEISETTISINLSGQSLHMIVVIYKSPEKLTHEHLRNEQIIDSFVVALSDDFSNPFQQFPEWTNNVKPFNDYSRCGPNLRDPTEFLNRPSTIGQPNDCQAGVKGDPHFIQTVYDAKSNEPINICYDVVGQNRQAIFILEDKLLETRIYGILLDDYYMHEIRTLYLNYKIRIDTKKISFDEKIIEWKFGKFNNIFFNHSNVQLSLDDHHTIRLTISNDKHQKISIIVKKSKNSFGIEHLDVGFKFLDRREGERYGGLIGDIQKKKVEEVMSVQDDKRTILKIDDKIVYGKKNRDLTMNECIHVSVKEIIHPCSIEEYVSFSI